MPAPLPAAGAGPGANPGNTVQVGSPELVAQTVDWVAKSHLFPAQTITESGGMVVAVKPRLVR